MDGWYASKCTILLLEREYPSPNETLYSEPANISASACSMHSLSTEPPPPRRVWLETGHSALRDHLMYSVRRPSPPQLERLRVCTPCPQQFSHSTRPSRSLMEAVGATSAIVGLAIPVFKCAKELRDRIKLVCPLSSSPFAYLHSAHDNSPSVSAGRIGESGTLGSTHRI